MNAANKKVKAHNHNNNSHDEAAPDGSQLTTEESITSQLKNRMLVSGEWLRLQKMLMGKLTGSEWEENLRCEAEARALEQDGPTLAKLISHLRPIAQNTIPAELKQEIYASIQAFIKANIQHDDDDDDDEDDAAMEEVV